MRVTGCAYALLATLGMAGCTLSPKTCEEAAAAEHGNHLRVIRRHKHVSQQHDEGLHPGQLHAGSKHAY